VALEYVWMGSLPAELLMVARLREVKKRLELEAFSTNIITFYHPEI
jgi:hypothetical protein